MNIAPDLLKRIESALDTIRPYLQADGGNIEVVAVSEDQILEVKLLGSCITCPMSPSTMKVGVEETIKMAIPELKGVRAINLPVVEK